MRFLLPATCLLLRVAFAHAIVFLFAVSATAQEVAWIIPEDGGTPRDHARIVRLAPGEYRTNRYTFTLQDEGAAAQLGVLHDFFGALPYWRMVPFQGVTEDAVALAEAGKLYVVYLSRGGSTTIDLTNTTGSFKGRWFNPRSGKFEGEFREFGGKPIKLTAPDAQDWAMLFQAADAN